MRHRRAVVKRFAASAQPARGCRRTGAEHDPPFIERQVKIIARGHGNLSQI